MDYAFVVEFLKHLFIMLVAGLVVELILAGKKHKRRQVRLNLANGEILQYLRKRVGAQELLDASSLNSTISSTARKYNLGRGELHSLNSLADDIINEVADNPFLSAKQKSTYCDLLTKVKNLNLGVKAPADRSDPRSIRGKDRVTRVLIAAAVGAVALTLVSPYIESERIILDIRSVFWLLFIAITMAAFVIWLVGLFREFQETEEGGRPTGIWKFIQTRWRKTTR